MTYDTSEGVKALVSNSNGDKWEDIDVVLAKDGEAGVIVGSYVFYISSGIIKMVRTEPSDLFELSSIASKKETGNDATDDEVSLQEAIDSRETISLPSGSIDVQKLSGYVTSSGVYKIFYYDMGTFIFSGFYFHRIYNTLYTRQSKS